MTSITQATGEVRERSMTDTKPMLSLAQLDCPSSLRHKRLWLAPDLSGCNYSVQYLAEQFDLVPDTVSVSHAATLRPPYRQEERGRSCLVLLPDNTYVVKGEPAVVGVLTASRVSITPASSRGSNDRVADVVAYKKFHEYPPHLQAPFEMAHSAKRRAFRKYAKNFQINGDVLERVTTVAGPLGPEVKAVKVLSTEHEVREIFFSSFACVSHSLFARFSRQSNALTTWHTRDGMRRSMLYEINTASITCGNAFRRIFARVPPVFLRAFKCNLA